MNYYRDSAKKACSWLVDQMGQDGSYGKEALDIEHYYKSPTLFLLLGEIERAHLVLDFIYGHFFQKNGDFLSSDQLKSNNPVLSEYYAYMNAWIVMAGQRLGRFDLSFPGYQFLKQFFHEDLGGAFTQSSRQTLDVFSTAHLGLTALYCGDLPQAERAGQFLQFMIDQQPNIEDYFLLRCEAKGKLLESFSDSVEPFCKIDRSQDNQLHFMIGYPIAFLSKLYLATHNHKYLDTASRYFYFALSCKGNLTRFHFSHKLAWGASFYGSVTGNEKAYDMAHAISEYLIETQNSDGSWLGDGEGQKNLDQTAEVAIWLLELSCNQRKLNPI